jgi:hypothetical protein
MSGDWKGLRPLVLMFASVLVIAWLCFAALIVLTATSANPVPRSVLLAWVLLAAGWVAIRLRSEHAGASWWKLALLAPSAVILYAIFGAPQKLSRWMSRLRLPEPDAEHMAAIRSSADEDARGHKPCASNVSLVPSVASVVDLSQISRAWLLLVPPPRPPGWSALSRCCPRPLLSTATTDSVLPGAIATMISARMTGPAVVMEIKTRINVMSAA